MQNDPTVVAHRAPVLLTFLYKWMDTVCLFHAVIISIFYRAGLITLSPATFHIGSTLLTIADVHLSTTI
jgi:hypothetical protein